jgi:hypothetical protein
VRRNWKGKRSAAAPIDRRRGRLRIHRSRWQTPAARRTHSDVASRRRWRRGSFWPVSRGRGGANEARGDFAVEAEREKGRGSKVGMGAPHGEEEEGVWQRDVAVRGGGGPAPAAMREWRRQASVGRRARAGAGAREAGRWAGLRGGVQLAVGREGMTGGPEPGKEKKEKENGFSSNLKLIFQIYSNLIRSKQTFPNSENLK